MPKGGIGPPIDSYKETVLPIKLFRLITSSRGGSILLLLIKSLVSLASLLLLLPLGAEGEESYSLYQNRTGASGVKGCCTNRYTKRPFINRK